MDYNKLKDEKYLVHLGKINGLDSEEFYVLVPDRKAMAIMLGLLNEKKYVIGQVSVLNLRDFEVFLKKLRDDNKPKGMLFGETNNDI